MTDPAAHQRTLAHIAELSRNARANWFGLIGLCLFVGVTLLGHKDADFFAYGAQTKLPLVNVDIPVTAFFVFAPLLVAALYVYLHLYLMNLWDALADAPARIGGQPLADVVFPWLISHAALWYRNRNRKNLGGGVEGSSRPRTLGWAVVAVSLLLAWIFGLAVLGFLWFRSLPYHDEWLALWTAACFWCALCVGWAGFRAVRLRMRRESREMAAATREPWRWAAGGMAFLLFFLSWEGTEGGLQMPGEDDLPPNLYPANLAEAVLTRKPSGTVDFEFWARDYEATYRKREGIDGGTDLTGNRKFIKEAVARYNAPLNGPDLQDADLRQAQMFRAFLPGADLRMAKMQGADLVEAQMQGADLLMAQMQGADLSGAQMQAANLFEAQMQGAKLVGAQMQGADLNGAQIQGADLVEAQMQGADLLGAQMQGADLRWAQMQGANLFEAQMQGAKLVGAQMQGADLLMVQMQGANLSGAKMEGAVLSGAQMQGSDLSEAQMENADCSQTSFRAAWLQSATLTCRNLTQWELYRAVGNFRTVLREGLTVASCLESLTPEEEDALAHHPEEGGWGQISRADIRKALLCPEGVKPVRLDYDPFERRFWYR